MLKIKQIVSAVIVAAMVFAFSGIYVSASVSGGTYVQVKYTGQVVDTLTFNSVKVNAVYSTSGGYGVNEYSCAALVMRFYKQVYGFDVFNLYSSSSVPTCSNGNKFIMTSTPRVGDIVRFSDRTHWALVKSVDGKKVTIMEQNWGVYTSGGYSAPVGRSVSVGDSQVSFFTYSAYSSAQKEKSVNYDKVYDSWEDAVNASPKIDEKKVSVIRNDNLKIKAQDTFLDETFGLKIK